MEENNILDLGFLDNLMSSAQNGLYNTPLPAFETPDKFVTGDLKLDKLNSYDDGLLRGIDQNQNRALNQSDGRALGNGIVQMLGSAIGEVLSTPGHIKASLDAFTGGEQDFSNAWTELFGEKTRDLLQDISPVYQTNETQDALFDPLNGEWWAGTAQNLGTTVGLMASTFLTAGLAAPKLLSLVGKMGQGSKLFNAGAKVVAKNPKLYSALTGKTAKTLSIASYSRILESTMEGHQTYKQSYDKLIKEGVDEEEAKKNAGIAARNTYLSNLPLVVMDFIEFDLLFKGFGKLGLTANLGLQSGLEGGEEAVQFAIGESSQIKAEVLSGLKEEEVGVIKSLMDNLDNRELQKAFVQGAVGGAIFQGIGALAKSKFNTLRSVGEKVTNKEITPDEAQNIILNNKNVTKEDLATFKKQTEVILADENTPEEEYKLAQNILNKINVIQSENAKLDAKVAAVEKQDIPPEAKKKKVEELTKKKDLSLSKSLESMGFEKKQSVLNNVKANLSSELTKHHNGLGGDSISSSLTDITINKKLLAKAKSAKNDKLIKKYGSGLVDIELTDDVKIPTHLEQRVKDYVSEQYKHDIEVLEAETKSKQTQQIQLEQQDKEKKELKNKQLNDVKDSFVKPFQGQPDEMIGNAIDSMNSNPSSLESVIEGLVAENSELTKEDVTNLFDNLLAEEKAKAKLELKNNVNRNNKEDVVDFFDRHQYYAKYLMGENKVDSIDKLADLYAKVDGVDTKFQTEQEIAKEQAKLEDAKDSKVEESGIEITSYEKGDSKSSDNLPKQVSVDNDIQDASYSQLEDGVYFKFIDGKLSVQGAIPYEILGDIKQYIMSNADKFNLYNTTTYKILQLSDLTTVRSFSKDGDGIAINQINSIKEEWNYDLDAANEVKVGDTLYIQRSTTNPYVGDALDTPLEIVDNEGRVVGSIKSLKKALENTAELERIRQFFNGNKEDAIFEITVTDALAGRYNNIAQFNDLSQFNDKIIGVAVNRGNNTTPQIMFGDNKEDKTILEPGNATVGAVYMFIKNNIGNYTPVRLFTKKIFGTPYYSKLQQLFNQIEFDGTKNNVFNNIKDITYVKNGDNSVGDINEQGIAMNKRIAANKESFKSFKVGHVLNYEGKSYRITSNTEMVELNSDFTETNNTIPFNMEEANDIKNPTYTKHWVQQWFDHNDIDNATLQINHTKLNDEGYMESVSDRLQSNLSPTEPFIGAKFKYEIAKSGESTDVNTNTNTTTTNEKETTSKRGEETKVEVKEEEGKIEETPIQSTDGELNKELTYQVKGKNIQWNADKNEWTYNKGKNNDELGKRKVSKKDLKAFKESLSNTDTNAPEVKEEVADKAKLFNKSDKELKKGSVVLYKGKKYLFWNNNKGKAQLITTKGIKFSGTPNIDKLEILGSYPITTYNSTKYIVTDNNNIYSGSTGKLVYTGLDNSSKVQKQRIIDSVKKPVSSNNKKNKKLDSINELFKLNNELSKLGTESQYLNYLDTIFPKSKIKDILFHGTDFKFEEFNLDNFGNSSLSIDSSDIVGISVSGDTRGAEFYGDKIVYLLANITNPISDIRNVDEDYNIIQNWKNYDAVVGSSSVVFGGSNPISNEYELIIRNPDQIHILGSNKDTTMFKEYLQSKNKPKTNNKEYLTFKDYFNSLANKDQANYYTEITNRVIDSIVKRTKKAKDVVEKELLNKIIIQRAKELANLDGVKKSIIGPSAINQYQIDYAELLEREGRSVNEIYEITKMERDIEGRWTKNLDVSNVKLKNNNLEIGEYELSDILDFPELFNAYPKLRKFKVNIKDLGSGIAANFNIKNKSINLNPDYKFLFLSALLHESQHYIQNIENNISQGTSTIESILLSPLTLSNTYNKEEALDLLNTKLKEYTSFLKNKNAKFFIPRINIIKGFIEEISNSNEDIITPNVLNSIGDKVYSRNYGEVQARAVQSKLDTLDGFKIPLNKLYDTVNDGKKALLFQVQDNQTLGAVDVNTSIMYLAEEANVSTFLHELAHLYEKYLTAEELAIIEQSNIQNEIKTGQKISDSEYFAHGFEQYLAGKKYDEKLTSLYDKFLKLLKDVISDISKALLLNPDMNKLYDKVLGFEVKKKRSRGSRIKDKPSKSNVKKESVSIDEVIANEVSKETIARISKEEGIKEKEVVSKIKNSISTKNKGTLKKVVDKIKKILFSMLVFISSYGMANNYTVNHDVTIDKYSKQSTFRTVSNSELFIDSASTHKGLAEIGNNQGFENKEFEKSMFDAGFKKGYPWCSIFIKYLFNGVNDKKVKETVNELITPSVYYTYKKISKSNNDIFKVATKKDVKVGSIVFYKAENSIKGHVVIVSSINEDGSFNTIEGNSNDDGSRDGYKVAVRKRTFDNEKLNFLGIVNPDYEKFSRDSLDNMFSSLKPKTRTKSVEKNTVKGNLEAELAYFKEKLPNIPTTVYSNVRELANKFGVEAYAIANKAGLHIIKNPFKGTSGHEVFEFVYHSLSKGQQKRLLRYAKRNRPDSYLHDDIDYLADEFMEYEFYGKKPKSSLLGNAFKELSIFLKSAVNYPLSVQELFYAISTNKYSKLQIKDFSFDNNTVRTKRLNSIPPASERALINRGVEMLTDEVKAYIEKEGLDNKDEAVRAKAFSTLVNAGFFNPDNDESITINGNEYGSYMSYLPKEGLSEKSDDYIDNIVIPDLDRGTSSILVTNILNGLYKNGIDVSSNSTVISNLNTDMDGYNTEEVESTELQSWQVNTQINPFEKTSQQLRQYLNNVKIVEKYDDNNEPVYVKDDVFDFEQTYDGYLLFKQLQYFLGNSVSEADMISKLEKAADINLSLVKVLLDVASDASLAKNMWKGIASNFSVKGSLALHKVDYIEGRDGGTQKVNNINLINSDRVGLVNNIVDKLYDYFSYNNKGLTDKDGNTSYNAKGVYETLNIPANIPNDTFLNKIDKDSILSTLATYGLLLPPNITRTDIFRVKHLIKDFLESDNPFNDADDVNKENDIPKNLAKELKDYYDLYSMSYTKTSGKGGSVQQYRMGNYVNKLIHQLKGGLYNKEHYKHLYNKFLKDIAANKGKLRDNLEIKELTEVKLHSKNKATDYNSFADVDSYLMMLAAYISNGLKSKLATIPLSVFSDAPTFYGVQVKKLDWHEGLEYIESAYKDEVLAIGKYLINRNNPNYMAGKKDKAVKKEVKEELGIPNVPVKMGEVFHLFPYMNKHIKANVKPEDIPAYIAKLNTLDIKKAYETWFNKERDQVVKDLVKIGVLEEIKSDSGKVTGYKSDYIQGKDKIETVTFAIHNLVAYQSNFIPIMQGDLGFYKGTADFFKRAKEIYSPGQYTYYTQEEYDKYGTTSMLIMQDLKELSDESTRKELAKYNPMFETKEHESTDAQSVIDLLDWKKRLKGLNKWTDAIQENYENLLALKPVDQNFFIEVLKPFYYNVEFNETKGLYPLQLKTSEKIWTPLEVNLYGNKEIKNLFRQFGYKFDENNNILPTTEEELMSNKDRIAGTAIFTTGVKAEIFGVVPLKEGTTNHDWKSLKGKNPTAIAHKIDLRNWRLQQETPLHHKDSTSGFGTQTMKLIIGDIEYDKVYKDDSGNDKTGRQLVFDYNKLVIEDIRDTYGSVLGRFDTIHELVDMLADEVKKRGLGDQYLEALELTRDVQGNITTQLPLWHPLHSYRIQAIANSMFKNKVTKQKLKNGVALINQSDYGFKDRPKIRFNENGILHYEAYVPVYSQELMKEEYLGDNGLPDVDKIRELNPELLKGILWRIPTEDKYSMMQVSIKGFLPHGSSVVLPKELPTIVGADKHVGVRT